MMKRLLMLFLVITNSAFSQTNTFPFPPSGPVGIGTTSPQMALEVVGWGQIIRNTVSTSYSTFRLYNELNNGLRSLEIDYSSSAYPNSLLTGGPTGEGAAIATTGAYPLSFGTRNTARMTITSGGNIGIGTATPSSKLHIDTYDAGDAITIGAIHWTGAKYAMGINSTASFVIREISSNAERLTISPSGSVGIGTTTPSAPLHVGNVNASIRIGAVNEPGNSAVAVGAQSAQYNLDFSGYRDIAPDQIGARIAALRFNNYLPNQAYVQSTGLTFYTNPSGMNSGTTDLQERMRIDPNGNVGIGTTTPGSFKLAVNGKIWGQEVQVAVNNPGPDYVFEKDYALPSLESVKTYIDQNKHLPEVPSAKEMEANGINLSEMNMLLLKKVEELTLYVIELKLENEETKQQVKSLLQSANQSKK